MNKKNETHEITKQVSIHDSGDGTWAVVVKVYDNDELLSNSVHRWLSYERAIAIAAEEKDAMTSMHHEK